MLRHDGTLVYYQLYEATSKKSLSPFHLLAFNFPFLTELDSSPSSRSTAKKNSSQLARDGAGGLLRYVALFAQ
jgi:hypothetical protein